MMTPMIINNNNSNYVLLIIENRYSERHRINQAQGGERNVELQHLAQQPEEVPEARAADTTVPA